MRLEWAVLSREVVGTGEGLDLLGIGTNTFWIAELPDEVNFYVTMQLAGERAEFESPHEVEVYIIGPEVSEDLSFTFDPQAQLGEADDVEVYELQPMAIVAPVRDYGVFTIEIYIDGERAKSIFFRVRPR